MLTILYTKLEGKLISYIIIFLTTQNNMPLTKKLFENIMRKTLLIILYTKLKLTFKMSVCT